MLVSAFHYFAFEVGKNVHGGVFFYFLTGYLVEVVELKDDSYRCEVAIDNVFYIVPPASSFTSNAARLRAYIVMLGSQPRS